MWKEKQAAWLWNKLGFSVSGPGKEAVIPWNGTVAQGSGVWRCPGTPSFPSVRSCSPHAPQHVWGLLYMKLASCYDKYFRQVDAGLLKIVCGMCDPLEGRGGWVWGGCANLDYKGSIYSNSELVSFCESEAGDVSLGMSQSGATRSHRSSPGAWIRVSN